MRLLQIKEFIGVYSVCDEGYIVSHRNKDKEMSPRDNGKGYKMIELKNSGIRKRWYIHRLIATYFVPNPNNYKEVNHIDGDKSNNRADNLEWSTRQENNKHSYRVLGRKSTFCGKVGALNYNSKRVKLKNIATGEEMLFMSVKDASEFVGVSVVSLYNVLKKRALSTKGYSIEYDVSSIRELINSPATIEKIKTKYNGVVSF